ncbi:hypothetical protein [Pseudomonas pudica]|uniref:Uncharacterized protein n=1 Tax=Pseudomonas pudica TaxID=272772 RepID=A0ABS0FUG5_9PSED|nr:hypothetical protein [Pseudomonas pudica]MBF8644015.1 hypothetical protein [Pseudomonas pudica]MBF8758618.1 hypothetical protein [Pseudomonas pudica]
MSDKSEPWFSLRNVRYSRKGEHAIDNVHLLFPMMSGEFEYALPSDCSDQVMRLVHFLFSSINEDDEFDNENFQKLLGQLTDPEGLTMKSLIKDEFLAVDFMVYSAFKAHKAIDESLGKLPPVNLGLRTSLLILQRVLGSFQSVAILIKNSMYFDVNCLLRSIMEQIGHAHQIREAKNLEEIKSFKSTGSITPLKEVIPEAGRLYGVLSDYIHNNNIIWGVYIEGEEVPDGDGHRTYVVTRSGKRTKDCIVTFSYIIHAYLAVLSKIYSEHCAGIESSFVQVVSDCCDHIRKMKKDMADKYYREAEPAS